MSTPSLHCGSTGPIEVGPGDARYEALRRGFNQRWIARPDHVVVATGTDDVVAAVDAWLDRHPGGGTPPRRITVRSGGHCYEDVVCGDDVSVSIDISAMDRVSYDTEMDAFCVEAGASNWHVATQLYRRYGAPCPAAPATPSEPAATSPRAASACSPGCTDSPSTTSTPSRSSPSATAPAPR
jgi:hypothetical protein